MRKKVAKMEPTTLEEVIHVLEHMGDWEVAQHKQDSLEKRGTRQCEWSTNKEPRKAREWVPLSTTNNMQQMSQFGEPHLARECPKPKGGLLRA